MAFFKIPFFSRFWSSGRETTSPAKAAGQKRLMTSPLIRAGITPQNGWRVLQSTPQDLMSIPEGRRLAETKIGVDLLNKLVRTKCNICIASDQVYEKWSRFSAGLYSAELNALFIRRNRSSSLFLHEAVHAAAQNRKPSGQQVKKEKTDLCAQAFLKGKMTKFVQAYVAREAGAYATQYLYIWQKHLCGQEDGLQSIMTPSGQISSMSRDFLSILNDILRTHPHYEAELRKPSGIIPLDLFDKFTASIINKGIVLYTHRQVFTQALESYTGKAAKDYNPFRFSPEQVRLLTAGSLAPAGSKLPYTTQALLRSGPHIAHLLLKGFGQERSLHRQSHAPARMTASRTCAPRMR